MRMDVESGRRRTVGLTPLIDVVFLLLLFFMLASRFSSHGAIPIGLGGHGAGAAEPAAMVLVTVAGDGRYLVNGRETPLGAMADALRATADGEARRVVVQPRPEATVQDIVSGLEAAAAAGVGDVVLMR